MKMRFPIQDIMSEEACYERLREILHPEGVCCPTGHRVPEDQAPHTRTRAPLVKWRCRQCGAVFDILTDTEWSGTHNLKFVSDSFLRSLMISDFTYLPT